MNKEKLKHPLLTSPIEGEGIGLNTFPPLMGGIKGRVNKYSKFIFISNLG